MTDREPPMPRRLALVTGGTRGIGRAIAARLLADGHDCIVTGTSPSAPASVPAGAAYHGADLADDEQLRALEALVARCEPSILVNNAWRNIPGETPGFEMSDYDLMHRVNLRAPFALIGAALPSMRRHGWGRIVSVTSIWGVNGHAANAAYCASKFGLDGLTASVAAEVARDGVLVNAVAPGYVATDQTIGHFSAEQMADLGEAIPAGRFAAPEEIAALVSWLVSAENTYLTGQNLLIDGGLTRTAMR